jgi:regulator of protease activity HflC (stomatin/prohibitin superfamily)
MVPYLALLIIVILFLYSAIKILNDYERGVIFRLGRIIGAEGEFQAAQKLSDAAKILGENPIALQLRYLQTLGEVATEKPSTTIFPVPIDLLTPFIK